MLSGKENETSILEHKDIEGAEESLVSVLLPPPIEGVVQQLSKLFVVTFNKRTTDYTTHLPCPNSVTSGTSPEKVKTLRYVECELFCL